MLLVFVYCATVFCLFIHDCSNYWFVSSVSHAACWRTRVELVFHQWSFGKKRFSGLGLAGRHAKFSRYLCSKYIDVFDIGSNMLFLPILLIIVVILQILIYIAPLNWKTSRWSTSTERDWDILWTMPYNYINVSSIMNYFKE